MNSGGPAAGVAAEAIVLRLGGPARGVLGRLREAGHSHPLVGLAEALALSPPARTMPGVVIGVQEHPTPLLVFVGSFDAAARARIVELGGLLREAATRMRILGWPEVEEACQRLADRLRVELGTDELERTALVGVPRGGTIVAGLLAYALGIPRERVGRTEGAETVVLVDDCAISGVRLREVLARFEASQRVVLATLLSHPELRHAVVGGEAHVAGFVSGADLRDHSDDILGADAEAWRRRWQGLAPTRYYTGLLDLPTFPWGEPQVRLFNQATRDVEAHWWLAPPSLCLQHRASPAGLEIQYMDDDPSRTHLAADVVPVRLDGAIMLIDTGQQAVVRLAGTAAESWDAWTRLGSIEPAADVVTDLYDVSNERAANDLRGLLGGLAARGLLADTHRP